MAWVGIANFPNSLVAAANAITVPAVTTLAADITNGVFSFPVSSVPWLWPTNNQFTIKIDDEVMIVTAVDVDAKIVTVTRPDVTISISNHVATYTGGESHSNGAAIDWMSPLRIVEGSTPTNQSTDDGRNIIQNITADGPLLKIGEPELQGIDDQTRRRNYAVQCVLYYGLPQNAVQSLADVTTLSELLVLAWRNQTLFAALSPSSATNISYGFSDIDYVQSPAFAQKVFTVSTTL